MKISFSVKFLKVMLICRLNTWLGLIYHKSTNLLMLHCMETISLWHC